MPDLISDSDQEYDKDEENEWNDDDSEEEMNMLTGNVTCLFCPVVESSVDLLLTHCIKQHNFDIIDSCRKWSTDCIGYIKMINYIRKMVLSHIIIKIIGSYFISGSNINKLYFNPCNDAL